MATTMIRSRNMGRIQPARLVGTGTVTQSSPLRSVAPLSFVSSNYSSSESNNDTTNGSFFWRQAATATAATAMVASACLFSHPTTWCDAAASSSSSSETKIKTKPKTKKKPSRKESVTPAQVSVEDFETLRDSQDLDQLPVYTMAQVAENNGQDGKPMWMTYGGIVYDVTNFIANHPGGSEKISEAAGSAIEPFWHIYRQHFASDLPMKLMEHLSIGRLSDDDQSKIDDAMAVLEEHDPYAREPMRHKALIVHSDTPMNAEVPSHLLNASYLTPTSLFYIRHHHPVPFLTEKQLADYRLKIDLSAYQNDGNGSGGVVEFTLEDLKQMPKVEIIATLQCSGNRRSGFNAHQRTSGTPWGQGAISTAKFGGVKLIDVLKRAGLDDPIAAQEQGGMNHVRFFSLDDMMASINIEKAANPYGDVIVCYEMNGEPLTREHGFPLRVIVPGYAAVRNVKWVYKIELAAEEAEGPWQRGLNYKTLPPAVTDASKVQIEKMPSMTEVSLFSGITKIEAIDGGPVNPGDRVKIKTSGWAWAGGGRNIVRVDVTADDGATWFTAELKEGSEQKFGRAWAWVFWECEIPEAVVREDGSVRLASKAVDLAFNVQPESANHTWNVRGLGNNSWYRAHTTLARTHIEKQ